MKRLYYTQCVVIILVVILTIKKLSKPLGLGWWWYWKHRPQYPRQKTGVNSEVSFFFQQDSRLKRNIFLRPETLVNCQDFRGFVLFFPFHFLKGAWVVFFFFFYFWVICCFVCRVLVLSLPSGFFLARPPGNLGMKMSAADQYYAKRRQPLFPFNYRSCFMPIA